MIQMERFFSRFYDLKRAVISKLPTVDVQKCTSTMTIVSKDFAVCTDKSHLWQWRKMGREIICVNVLTVLFVVWFVLVTKDSLVILTNNYNKTTMIGVQKEPDVLNGTYNLRVDPLIKAHGHALRGRGSDEGAVRRAKRSNRMFLSEKTPYNRGLKSFIGKVTVDKLLGIDKNVANEKSNSSKLEMSFESSGFQTIDPPFFPTLKSENDTLADIPRNWLSASPGTGNKSSGGGGDSWGSRGKRTPDEDLNIDYKSGLQERDKMGGPFFYYPSSWKRSIRSIKDNDAVAELEELVSELFKPSIFDIKPKDSPQSKAEESFLIY